MIIDWLKRKNKDGLFFRPKKRDRRSRNMKKSLI